MPTLKEKEREKQCEEFRKTVEEELQLLTKLKKEETDEKCRKRKDFIRRLHLERREAGLNGVVLKAQEVSTLQQNQLAQEEKLAAELDLIRRKEIVDEKLRLHLRENSHELKKLESQLGVAYMKKALAAQLAEKEANKLEEQMRERRAREILVKAVGTLEEQEEEARINEQKQKAQFRHSLQDQIIEKERLRQEEFIKFMNEKKMSEDILKKIKEDEVKELEEKQLMQQKIKQEMEQFYKAREMWKAQERFIIQEEEEKIKRIQEEKAKMADQLKAEKKTNKDFVEKVYKKVAQEILEKKKKVEEREELLSSLMWKEKEEKENKKLREEAEKEEIRKREARATYQKLLTEKNRKRAEEKEQERKFAEQMKLKLEEEERKEKEKQEQRRQTQINNRKYNEEAMKKNVEKRAEGLKLKQLINELQEKEEERKATLIEEERRRMLQEHAPLLLGYFPKGCLKPGDLEALGVSANSPPPQASCPLSQK